MSDPIKQKAEEVADKVEQAGAGRFRPAAIAIIAQALREHEASVLREVLNNESGDDYALKRLAELEGK